MLHSFCTPMHMIHMYTCMYIMSHMKIFVYIWVCMCVCVHACAFVCVCACMCVCVYAYFKICRRRRKRYNYVTRTVCVLYICDDICATGRTRDSQESRWISFYDGDRKGISPLPLFIFLGLNTLCSQIKLSTTSFWVWLCCCQTVHIKYWHYTYIQKYMQPNKHTCKHATNIQTCIHINDHTFTFIHTYIRHISRKQTKRISGKNVPFPHASLVDWRIWQGLTSTVTDRFNRSMPSTTPTPTKFTC